MSDKLHSWDTPFDLNRDGKLDLGEQLIKYKVISDIFSDNDSSDDGISYRSPSKKEDLVVRGCIINKEYNVVNIDIILFDFGCAPLKYI